MPNPRHTTSLAFHIDGMACSGCVERVEKAIRAVPGVASVSVDLERKHAEVVLSGETDGESVAGAIRAAGYEAVLERAS